MNTNRSVSNYFVVLMISLSFLLSTCKTSKLANTVKVPTTFQNIKIGDDSSGMRLGPCEPSIFINPRNPKNIVAASVLNNVYHSFDGGLTWTEQQVDSPYGVFGDPSINADSKGNFYFLHLSDPGHKGWSDKRLLDRIVIQKSTDGGKTWNEGSHTKNNHPKDQDKEWMAVDYRNDHLYVSWTEFDLYNSKKEADHSRILLSKSEDGAATWSEPIVISEREGNCLDNDDTVEGAVPAVGPNGEVYVAWCFEEKIWFDRSFDGGLTWLDKDIEAAEQPGGWDFEIEGIGRANGFTVTGVDISDGPNKGSIYINFSDQRNGKEDTDIWLIKSTDKGNSWSSPIRVNDDQSGEHQFFNWMSVDPVTGNIYIVFYDQRNSEDEMTDVYLAWSTDGGNSFTNKKISESPFPAKTSMFFGDYNNISAYNGIVRPIWTRVDKNGLSVWTAIINMQ